MSSSYLSLVNQVLTPFNEVQLDSTTFASATGFHAEVKNNINQAIYDIYTEEDIEWPFLHGSLTITTTAGTADYTRSDSFTNVDWDSFKILRPKVVALTLSQTGGVATFTSSLPHYLVTGDTVLISGATPDDYNGSVQVTVTGSTSFTYTVPVATTSPATGTIVMASLKVFQKRLKFKDVDSYREEGLDEDDANTDPTAYTLPNFVVRKSNNSITFSPVPDRVYQIYYEGFAMPSALSLYDDVSIIPAAFEQVIVDKALHYAYMFRDNIEEAGMAQQRYEHNVNKMRRAFIAVPEYFRAQAY